MLTDEHEVWFVGLDAAGEVTEDIEALGLAGTSLVRMGAVSPMRRALVAVATGGSLQAASANESAMTREIERVTASFRPDVAHFNVIRSAPHLAAVGDLPVIFDFDEYRSEYYRQLAGRGLAARGGIVGRVEFGRMATLEERVTERSDVILVSSPVDVLRSPKAALVRSPHHLVHGRGSPDASRQRVLFVGRMGYAPNRDGLSWFVERVWPRVRGVAPRAELDVVGEGPPASIRRSEGNGVRIWGPVADVSPFYASASIAIAPITVGTGVQMKVIQALAMGVPTIATSQALARAGATPGVHALAADDTEGWVDAVTSLMTNPDRAAGIGQAGRRWAEVEYGDATIRRSLRMAYDVSGSGGSRAPGE
jgi:glycosyltransferase involved in cell wall biosynthesis